MNLFLALIISLFATVLYADNVYQYTDSKGQIVFTNKPVKNAKKVKLPPISVYAAPMSKNDYKSKNYTNKPNDNVAKIYVKKSADNLGTNEVGRNEILNDELGKEKLALSDSQQALTQAKKTKLPSEQNNPELYQQRIQSLQDAVTEHQKNIDILSKQLGQK